MVVLLLSASILAQQPDSGRLTGRIYENAFFAFEYPLPETCMMGTPVLGNNGQVAPGSSAQRGPYRLLDFRDEPDGRDTCHLQIMAYPVDPKMPVTPRRMARMRTKEPTGGHWTTVLEHEIYLEPEAIALGGQTVHCLGIRQRIALLTEEMTLYLGYVYTQLKGYTLHFEFTSDSHSSLEAALASVRGLQFHAPEADPPEPKPLISEAEFALLSERLQERGLSLAFFEAEADTLLSEDDVLRLAESLKTFNIPIDDIEAFQRNEPDETEESLAEPELAHPAPEPTSATVPIRIPSGVAEGNLLRRVRPEYPPGAEQARITGIVVLVVVIDTRGKVKTMQLVSGHPLLAQAAVDAVRQFEYLPFRINDELVDAQTIVEVVFPPE